MGVEPILLVSNHLSYKVTNSLDDRSRTCLILFPKQVRDRYATSRLSKRGLFRFSLAYRPHISLLFRTQETNLCAIDLPLYPVRMGYLLELTVAMGGIRTLDDFQSCMIFHLLKRHPMANCSDAPLPFVASHHGKLNSPEVWIWTKQQHVCCMYLKSISSVRYERLAPGPTAVPRNNWPDQLTTLSDSRKP